MKVKTTDLQRPDLDLQLPRVSADPTWWTSISFQLWRGNSLAPYQLLSFTGISSWRTSEEGCFHCCCGFLNEVNGNKSMMPYCNTEADMNPLASIYSGKSCGIVLFVAAVLTDQAKMLGMVVSISVSNMCLMSPSCSAWWYYLGGLPVRSPHFQMKLVNHTFSKIYLEWVNEAS